MTQQPPGYGGAGYGQLQPTQSHMAYGQHVRPAEVEGGNRSKAQLIVGIDFVSVPWDQARDMLTPTGHHLLGGRLCLCDQYRSKRRHNNGVARRG